MNKNRVTFRVSRKLTRNSTRKATRRFVRLATTVGCLRICARWALTVIYLRRCEMWPIKLNRRPALLTELNGGRPAVAKFLYFQSFASNGLRESVRYRTCYDQPVCQMWSSYLHLLWQHERQHKMYKIRWLWVTQGHRQCHRKAHTASYCIWVIRSHLSRLADFHLFHRHLLPLLGKIHLECRRNFRRQKTGVCGLSCGVV